jgi:polysaccharide biosynthesis protein PslH
MKVLFLCNKSPYPALEGGPIAMNSIIEGLLEAGHQVKILAVNSDKYNIIPDDIPEDYKQKTGIELVHLELGIKPIDAFLSLLQNKSYHVERFISPAFTKKLIQLLDSSQFDVVQLETLFMVPYITHIRKHSKAIIVLRAHNIEHLIWHRLAEQSTFLPKRLYLKHLTHTLKNFELKALNQVDGIAAITRKDADFFRGNSATPVIDIPFGIDPLDFQITESETKTPTLFHIGAMNWLPNEEGIRWFLDQVWPEVNKRLPELKFYLAGRYMPEWLVTGYKPNIIVVGEVESAHNFVRSKTIAIVPLLSGSGIRIKIIEAMALGKTVITTEIGAEGIFYKNEKNILIASNANEFIRSIEKCANNLDFCDLIGKNARKLIEEVYDKSKIINRLLLFYNELKKRTTGQR